MYNTDNEYLEATQNARINQDNHTAKSKRNIFLPLALVSAGVLGIVGFNSLISFSETTEKPTQQMTSISNQHDLTSDASTLVKMEKSEKPIAEKAQEEVAQKYFVITVKKGDSLASLSKKYFGNEMYFDRILVFNKGLTKKSVLNIGQRINIPH